MSPLRTTKTVAKKIPGAAKLYRAARLSYGNREYRQWLANQPPLVPPKKLAYRPLISIVVPAFNTPQRYLEALVASVQAQQYGHWQLCLVNASPDAGRRAAIAALAARDDRITHVALAENGGIAGNTNAGIELATGDYIAFLDHDDTIAPDALQEMVVALDADRTIDVLYSDEDKLTDDGRQRCQPFFKPELSPALLLTSNYVCHFLTVRAPLLRRLGGIRSGFDGAQDYDLVLRLMAAGARFHRIPRMLYHWRLAANSTATLVSQKNYAVEAGRRALAEYVARRRIKAEVSTLDDHSTIYRLHYAVGPAVKILVVTGEAGQERQLGIGDGRISCVAAADYTPERLDGCAVVVFVAPGVTATTTGWLEELAGRALQPDAGMVAAAVADRAGRSALGYVATGGRLQLLRGEITHPTHGYIGATNWPRNLVALPAGGWAVRCELLQRQAPHFTPSADGPGVAELSLGLFAAGHTNVFWPYARLVQAAGFVAPADPIRPATPHRLPATDPYFNPNLTLKNGQLRLP